MDKDIKNILSNTAYLYMVQGLNVLLPLVVLPYLIKTLSLESFGIYSFSFAFSQFILLVVDFGFNISATKKIAENQHDEYIVRNTFWNIIFIKLTIGIISLIFTLLLFFLVPKIRFYSEAILWTYIMVLGTILFPLWWFQGLNKMRIMSIISMISKLCTYPMMFVFVKTENDYIPAIIIQSLSFLAMGILSFIYISKNYSSYFQNITITKKRDVYIGEIKNSWGIFLANSSVSLYTNSLTILLGFFGSNHAVGLFGAMEKIIRMICVGILSPINQACFPIIVTLKKNNLAKAKNIYRITFIIVFVFLFLVYIGYFITKNFIIDYLFKDYQDVDKMLSIFMLIIFPIALGGIIGQLRFLGLGEEKEKKIFSKVYLWAGIFSVPLSLLCIKYFTLWGAIISMMTVETLVFLMFIYAIKLTKTN